MRTLAIRHTDVTREALLALAEKTPGAWLGVKVAIIVLLLDGYRPTFLARLFGVTRMSLTRWIHRLNAEGPGGLAERQRPGRPKRLTPQMQRQLQKDLEGSPEEQGLPRASWDGPTLVLHLQRRFGVKMKVRQAQNWLHRLGFRLKQAGYVYLQARPEEAEAFRRRLKKTPPVQSKGRSRLRG